MTLEETRTASTAAPHSWGHASTSAALSAVGVLLLATSYFAPGFRPGDGVGANIGAGFLLLLATLFICAGVAVGIVGFVRRRVRLVTALCLVVLPIVGGGLVGAVGQLQHRNYDDQAFQVRIVNDTPQPVGVAQCNGDGPQTCSRTETVQVLAPGEFAVAYDGISTANPWRVTTSDGILVGCLSLPVSGSHGEVAGVDVSSASPGRC